MPVQFRAIDRRRNPRDLFKQFEESADRMKRAVLSKAANAIVAFSPVDTGTYIMAHSIQAGGRQRRVAGVSSADKERGQSKEQFVGPALAQLEADIDNLPAGFTDVMLINAANHAPLVEYLGWENTEAYYVYTETRARMPQFIEEAARETGFK